MSLFLAIVVVVVFAVVIERFALAERSHEVVARARGCLEILRDPSLDDDAKAAGLQRHALRLFRIFGIFLAAGLLAGLLPLAGVWAMDRAGLASLSGVLAILERPDFLAGAVVVGTLIFLLSRRLRPG